MAWPDTPVILLGPSGDDACRQAALENGAHAVLPKPVEPNDLVRTLRSVASAPATLSSTLVSTEGGARRPGSRDGRSCVMRRADERRAGARARSHQGGNGRAPAYRG
jgi:DNA-binding NarL/FixJ family response regulator